MLEIFILRIALFIFLHPNVNAAQGIRIPAGSTMLRMRAVHSKDPIDRKKVSALRKKDCLPVPVSGKPQLNIHMHISCCSYFVSCNTIVGKAETD
jgi:hypothetical protein